MVSEKIATETKQKQSNYELTIVVSPEESDESLETVIEGISQFITGKGGTVAEVARWGKKRLAYAIKHFNEGNYVLLRFQLPPSQTRELKNNLRISEKLLRHLLINTD